MITATTIPSWVRALSGEAKNIYLVIVASPQSTQHFVRRKSKDLLARNQDNVSEWSDMSTRGL